MIITPEIQRSISDELLYDLGGKLDGSRRNILVPNCPFCGHDGFKYGIYIGSNAGKKRFGMSNCYHCNRRFGSLKETLKALGREDLIPVETAELDDDTDISAMFDDEIDDDLVAITMPRGYKRCYKNAYLKSRGWNTDDYEYFPVGTNRAIEREYQDYIILEVLDEGRRVGFVARSILSKEEIDSYNARHHYQIRRYKNSDERNGNGFAKMLYNYDAIEPMVTHSVILCEGPFDVVGLNRKLELYDNKSIVPVATFGKKISQEQMFKLQKKGVEQIVIGYDNDAKETTSRIGMELEKYFDVLIADIPDGVGKDWDEMDVEDIYDVFAFNLKTIREFNLT
jgi:DNA primase|uniref:DNA primase, catalytic core n=1 Tax=Siphoviridae sp. ctOCb13 TaxID=2825477 RepID=A0A8S5Q0A6_9CAUD|nr:MAG TPA: DNA primase, catalytic core [Siphoviridae sp. ctOCb13]